MTQSPPSWRRHSGVLCNHYALDAVTLEVPVLSHHYSSHQLTLQRGFQIAPSRVVTYFFHGLQGYGVADYLAGKVDVQQYLAQVMRKSGGVALPHLELVLVYALCLPNVVVFRHFGDLFQIQALQHLLEGGVCVHPVGVHVCAGDQNGPGYD